MTNERRSRGSNLIRPLVLSLHLFPGMSDLAHGKPLLSIDSDNTFTPSRALNSKRVLPVSFQGVLSGDIPLFSAPSAPSLGASCFCATGPIVQQYMVLRAMRGVFG
jgi:hypothetical protein